MPFMLCGACLSVVLENSEKARSFYDRIVESYRLPDIEAAFERLEVEMPPAKAIWNEMVGDLRERRAEKEGELKLLLPDGDFFEGFKEKASRY